VTSFLRLQNPAMFLQKANDLEGIHILHDWMMGGNGKKIGSFF
jgi:hypothetical protein